MYISYICLSFKYLENKLCCHGDINEYISSNILEPPRFCCGKLACRHVQSSHTIWGNHTYLEIYDIQPIPVLYRHKHCNQGAWYLTTVWAAGWGLAHVKDSSRSLAGWVVRMDRLGASAEAGQQPVPTWASTQKTLLTQNKSPLYSV